MSFNIAAFVLPATEQERGRALARWLQLDGKIINLDQVAYVEPRQIKDVVGAQFAFVNPDCYLNTQKSVDEICRLIEAAEGPEPPKALITDHDYDGLFGGVYECAICHLSKGTHAK